MTASNDAPSSSNSSGQSRRAETPSDRESIGVGRVDETFVAEMEQQSDEKTRQMIRDLQPAEQRELLFRLRSKIIDIDRQLWTADVERAQGKHVDREWEKDARIARRRTRMTAAYIEDLRDQPSRPGDSPDPKRRFGPRPRPEIDFRTDPESETTTA
jgi:hypothetical protein